MGDQETDILDLFGVVYQLETHLLVRTRANDNAGATEIGRCGG
jgi:hypothetical protein